MFSKTSTQTLTWTCALMVFCLRILTTQTFTLSSLTESTADVIQYSALHTKVSGGLSGVDALTWRRISTVFRQKSNDLCSCSSGSCYYRRICTTYVDPVGLMAYTACSLVPRPLPPEERPGTHCLRMRDIFRYIFRKKLRALILSVCGRLY